MEIRPWPHHIVFGTQIIRKIYSVPLRFYSEPLMLSSEPLNLKSMKKCFRSYLILTNNSVDYHEGVHFVALCKFWNILKKIFLDFYAVENCKRNFVIILFKSKTKATFDGVDDIIGWVKKIIKKKVKMVMRREGQKVTFQDKIISLKTINIHTACFYLIFTKTYFRKN